MAAALNDRYKFQKYPKAEELRVSAPNGLEFAGGSFRNRDGDWIVTSFTIFNDGLVAETRSRTDDTDAFISDLLGFVTRQFRLKFEESMVQEKTYLSQIIVSSERVWRSPDPKLTAFSDYLSSMFRFSAPVQTTGMHFGPDPAVTRGRSFAFRLERKTQTPFGKNLYFSEAPLTTDKHLGVS